MPPAVDLRWPGDWRLVQLGAFLVALILGLFSSYVWERGELEGRVARGVRLESERVATMNRAQLRAVLDSYRERVEEKQLRLTLAGEHLDVSASTIGLSIDQGVVLDELLRLGKSDKWLADFGFWLTGLFSEHSVSLPLTVDEVDLRKAVEGWADDILKAPKLPRIAYSGELLVEPGRGGTVIEYEQVVRRLQARPASLFLAAQPPVNVRLVTRERAPVVPAADVARAKKRAQALVSGPITVLAPGAGLEHRLSPSEFGRALDSRIDEKNRRIVLELDVDRLQRSMKGFLKELERPAVDAQFSFPKAGAPEISESEAGIALDREKLVKEIWAASKQPERRAKLSLVRVEPDLTKNEAEELGISGLVKAFSTRHPCCQPRVKNIHHAAAQLDGVVLRPGEKFSLNDHLGPRRAASGYLKAPTIVRGDMEEMYGGGISQLATTLFNAVLRGGYEIIQRQPHSVYFPRYPEGHEATVSYPLPDLIFRNDTKAGMVIKTQAAPTYIRVLVYGDNGGRVTTVNKSRRYDIVDPPKEYEPDESMSPEESKRLRAGQLGWTVLVSRKVKFPDGEEKVEKREVVYNPRPELLRVHPCMIPEGKEGYTGEACPEPEIVEVEEDLSEDVFYETW